MVILVEKSYSIGKIILSKLNQAGYEAYFVGGFVRDYLLNIPSLDIDITTNALPEEVENLFENTKATGKKYGTITVFIEGKGFEVTTYRLDQDYRDYRKPESVSFSSSLSEDLKRRDFTINALAMDIDGKVIDLFMGKEDLENKIIRAIGNPDQRFNEDALRIIRALKFVSRYNFSVEDNTLSSMKKNIKNISYLPNERIIPELEEIFSNVFNKAALKYMKEINIKEIFPEFSLGIDMYLTSKLKLSFIEFMAMSLYLLKEDIPEYWRFSKKDKLTIYRLIHIIKSTIKTGFNALLVYELGKEMCLKANEIISVIESKNHELDIENIYRKLPIKRRDELAINGNDIKNIKNIENEEVIGEIIEEIELQVVNGHLENEHEELINYAKNFLERIDG